jgi:TRAP-type C4-dicarboxylate transport system substrate-binding protein
VRRILIALIVLGLGLSPTEPLLAQKPITIKLATLVPDRSVWGTFLREMGSDWKKATNSRVNLRIYPGMVAGDDPDVVRKMRIGQLNAGTLTLTGLVEIDDSFSVFGIPLYFDSYEEYFYVIEQLQPVLEKRLQDKGFVLINWGHGGWIHLFSTTPITTIKQLQKHKLFVWAGDDRMVTWYQKNGFRPVALQLPDVVTGLQTGMIDAMPSTPLAALALQWFRTAPYMLDMGFAPFLGATVVTKRSWKKISPADQEAILEVSREASLKFRTEIPIQDENAVIEMSKRGLEVIAVTDDAALAEWRAATEKFAANMRDSIVPPEIFDLAQKARQEFRSKQ